MKYLVCLVAAFLMSSVCQTANAQQDVFSPINGGNYYLDLTPTSSAPGINFHLQGNPNEPVSVQVYMWVNPAVGYQKISNSSVTTNHLGIYQNPTYNGPLGIWMEGSYKMVLRFNYSQVRRRTIFFDITDSTPATPGPWLPLPNLPDKD